MKPGFRIVESPAFMKEDTEYDCEIISITRECDGDTPIVDLRITERPQKISDQFGSKFKKTPEDTPRLGSVPKRNRWKVRQALQEVHSMAIGLRACMPLDHLSLPEAIADLDTMIGRLEHCKRELRYVPR
jgi:hypothetical protein